MTIHIITQEQASVIAAIIDGSSGHPLAKYSDVLLHYGQAFGRVMSLQMHAAPPGRCLDLGGGFGYTSAALAAYGHEAINLDIDDPITREVTAIWGVEFVGLRIAARVTLPVGGLFDLITMFRVNVRSGDTRWDFHAYADYVKTILWPILRKSGRIHFDPNREAEFLLDADAWRVALGKTSRVLLGKNSVTITREE